MGERISKTPVIDRTEYAGKFVYVDTEGYACVAERGGGKKLSEAERLEREDKVNKWKRDKVKVMKTIRELKSRKIEAYKADNVDKAKSIIEEIDVAQKDFGVLKGMKRKNIYAKY